jgi:2-methylcitrate dehydratase PrpD
MPATSKAQQKAAGAALSAKRGETKPSELYGSSKEMYDSMSEEELEDFASTKRKDKPEKKQE